MALENLTCFGCGEKGHLERECPDAVIDADGRKPPWCGICDPRTRLTGLGPDGPVTRCPQCHPLRGRHVRQHKRCPGCKMIIHQWDTNPCGSHSSPLKSGSGPAPGEIDAITAREGVRK